MTTKAKPTKGPWKIIARLDLRGNTVGHEVRAKNPNSKNGENILFVSPDSSVPEALANAELIAEAGTVYHETGLTPRELKEQRDIVLEALSDIEALADREAQIKSGAKVDVNELLPDILKLVHMVSKKVGGPK